MAGPNNFFDLAGRAMSAQMVRLNTVASNLANANSVASTKEDAFRPLRPVFEAAYADAAHKTGVATVNVSEIVQLDREPVQVYRPDHPMADKDGYIYQAAVDQDEEMVDMIEANRQYQNTVSVVSTVRTLMMRTLNMGK